MRTILTSIVFIFFISPSWGATINGESIEEIEGIEHEKCLRLKGLFIYSLDRYLKLSASYNENRIQEAQRHLQEAVNLLVLKDSGICKDYWK